VISPLPSSNEAIVMAMRPNSKQRTVANPYIIPLKRSGEILPEASRVFLLLKLVGLIYALCPAPVAFAQVRYQITRLPTAQGTNSVALGINNSGEVVGYSFQGEDYQAFLYSSSLQSVTLVGSLGGKTNAACAINDAGQVTGYSQEANGNLLFSYLSAQPKGQWVLQSARSLLQLFSAAIGVRYEDPSDDLAHLGDRPGLRNYVVKTVFTQIRQDRCIRITAGNN
jgi:probable HAF family extracellular repeat protein